MRRLHLIEIEDQPWCPRSIRDSLTDLLQFAFTHLNVYTSMVPRMRRALEQCQTTEILDLCSGGGGPWLRLIQIFEEREKFPIGVCLTDKFPNTAAFELLRRESNQKISFHSESTDVTKVPQHLRGFRTMFTSFHHFRPEQARDILANAVENRSGIGIFEVARRHPAALLGLTVALPAVFFATPFIRPFRWSRILWTYLLPLVPLIAYFDGVVSCFRSYTVRELQEFAEEFVHEGYTWEIGQERSARFLPIAVTYLIGCPANPGLGDVD